jgi:dihydroorotate dehydrogenase electron transfer subunit
LKRTSRTLCTASPPECPAKVAALSARVVTNERLCREHVLVEVQAERFPPSHPGQFLELLCRALHDPQARLLSWEPDGRIQLSGPDWGPRQAYLRRPFSIADRWQSEASRVHLSVISRNIGPGTEWLERLRPGATLNLTGPLGRGFQVADDGTPLVLVGGGVGIPPLLYLARVLSERGRGDVWAILGATTADLLPLRFLTPPARDATATPCVALAGAARYPTIVTTDDGSLGVRGRVTDGLRAWSDAARPSGPPPLVLACGPDAMLRAVARLTRELDMACQLCIEKPMGCGLGTCLSCVARLREPSRPQGWRWALACTEGPVFQRDQLMDAD